MKYIIDKIKASVKPAMDQWVADGVKYITALEQYCKFDVYKEPELVGLNISKKHIKLHELRTNAGYTKACERYFGSSKQDLKERLEKDAALKMAKIDVAVAKKLNGITVETVELLYFSTTGKDSFCEGAWKINGNNVFSFRTIYAGGWNIQMLHIRTIYSYK